MHISMKHLSFAATPKQMAGVRTLARRGDFLGAQKYIIENRITADSKRQRDFLGKVRRHASEQEIRRTDPDVQAAVTALREDNFREHPILALSQAIDALEAAKKRGVSKKIWRPVEVDLIRRREEFHLQQIQENIRPLSSNTRE